SDAMRANPTPEGYRTAISDYFRLILDVVAPLVPAVKPQFSLLESLTWVGAQILIDITDHARSLDSLVIADAKRGDIASSALGYARAFLDPPDGPDFARGYNADCLTVNPFLGRDTLRPYVDACDSAGKGIFVLVKTSNPGSGETQDALLADSNRPVYTSYARMV